jgi:glycosyltransferase involved in cell wall biosynthesis
MRICLYTETALPKIGGQELVVDALAREFQAQGHEVVVLAQYPRRPLLADDRRLPYPVVRHPRFVSTWRWIAWYRHFLTRLHRKFPFDVLHCHSLHPCGYLGTLCKDSLGVPLVITSHGSDVRNSSTRLRKPGLRERSVLALEQADAVISISRSTAEGFARLSHSARVVEIPNGVNFDALAAPVARPAELNANIRSHEYVLFLGRLHPCKGVDVLLEAWARLRASGTSSAARPMLVVAGDGQQRESLLAQAERLGIADRIHFVGSVSGDTKSWLLQNAIGVCLPSRRWEAFPLVVLESYAAGKPVIGSRIAGLQDLIRPGETGWLVPPESPTALTQAIEGLLADRTTSQCWGAEARQTAVAYGWPSVAARHLELYQRLRISSLPQPMVVESKRLQAGEADSRVMSTRGSPSSLRIPGLHKTGIPEAVAPVPEPRN